MSLTPVSRQDLLSDYRGRGALWFAALFWAALAGAYHWQGKTLWLALTAQLWVGYSGAYVGLWWYSRRTAAPSWCGVLTCLGVGSVIGALVSLLLAEDFVPARLASAGWAMRRTALPLGFALALHLPGLALRWRAWQAYRQRIAASEQAAALADLSRQLTLAELRTLQAQVEPHFLYNTLASVQYLVRHEPAMAERMLDHLHGYLRMALPAMRAPTSTLGQEVALAAAYLEIMRIRLGPRLRVTIDLPPVLADQPFPPMMLATLVENAVQHGIEPRPEGGDIMVSVRQVQGRICLTVSDTGQGLVAAGECGPGAGSGVGLANVRDRLRSLYGERAALTIDAVAPHGVCARISLPAGVVTARPADTAPPAQGAQASVVPAE